MPIQNISTANTFYQWTILTQKLVSEVNEKFVTFTENPVYSNTNINANYDVDVNDIYINGNFILNGLSETSLDVSGNAVVQGIVESAGSIIFNNLSSNNANVFNTTSNYFNGINLQTSNINVASNIVFTNTLNLNSIDVTTGTANIYSLTGNSYINIINTIQSSNAYVFAQDNISNFIAFTIGLG